MRLFSRIFGASDRRLGTTPVETPPAPTVRRLSGNPIITPSMLSGHDGDNINGPSLIRAPDFASDRLGRYYLYFAHHSGSYIRLAYADDLVGPWKVLPGGVLDLSTVEAIQGHVASPDVIVDHSNRRIRLYFHGPSVREGGAQRSFVALSTDGLSFKSSSEALGIFYFRVFESEGAWYAMAKGGLLYRSHDGLTAFKRGLDTYVNAKPGTHRSYNKPGNIRHVAVHRVGARLAVYFTRIGDAPERIFRAWINLQQPWTEWVLGGPVEVLRPSLPYEGSTLPLRASKSGSAREPENAVRDPAIFVDADEKVYLLYSVKGERGIAIAEVTG